jgi:hypothetical protein
MMANKPAHPANTVALAKDEKTNWRFEKNIKNEIKGAIAQKFFRPARLWT